MPSDQPAGPGAPLASQHRRKSSVVDPLSGRSPHTPGDQHRRKSSLVGPLSVVSPHAPGDGHRRKSSLVGPPPAISQKFGGQHRRRSSTIDPHTASRRSSDGDEEPQARSDTRHIRFAIPEDAAVDEVDENAMVLAKPPPAVMSPLFNQDFTLNGLRRGSDSLQNQHLLSSEDTYHPGQQAGRRKSSCVMVNRRASKYTIEEEKVVRQVGKKRLYWTKVCFIIGFIAINCGFSAISWLYPQYWYVFAPVILLGNFLNTAMVLNLVRHWIQSRIAKGFRLLFNRPKAPLPTEIPTTIAMVLACYCESYTDLMRTLDSLSEQEKVDHHKKMFIVVCDGQVKGKGMEKSTDRILVEDIFKPDEEMFFPVGYVFHHTPPCPSSRTRTNHTTDTSLGMALSMAFTPLLARTTAFHIAASSRSAISGSATVLSWSGHCFTNTKSATKIPSPPLATISSPGSASFPKVRALTSSNGWLVSTPILHSTSNASMSSTKTAWPIRIY